MFGIVNPTNESSRESYAALVSGLEDKKAVEPADGPFGGALIDNPGPVDGNHGDGSAPTVGGGNGGAVTTGVGGDGPQTTGDVPDAEGSDPGPGSDSDPSSVSGPDSDSNTGPGAGDGAGSGIDNGAEPVETGESGAAGALVGSPGIVLAMLLGVAMLLV
jgi:hypothetical protein